MVGKLQDVVSAAVVVGAAEKVNMNVDRNKGGALSSLDTPAATVETSQRPFIIDTKGMKTDDGKDATQKQEEKEFQLEPGSVDEETVNNITEELNELMSKINCNLSFNYHKEVNVMSIRMIDKETNEVIKELPPEEMITNMMKSKIWLGAVIGSFVDKSA